jgi:hypothetical protein
LAVVGLAVGALVLPMAGGLTAAGASSELAGGHVRGNGHSNGAFRFRSQANMTNHGGRIMPTANIKAIFWGTSWNTASAVGDKISGVDTFYTGFSGSNYAKTSDEYTDSGGHQVGPTTTYGGHLIDTSVASGGSNTGVILNEVAKEITTPDPTGNGYYPVYTDVPRGNAQYCAWHSSGTVHGVTVEFAFFFRLDGDPGCDPGDTTTGHSQGLAALANVSAHELSEARSDPNLNAWYDNQGQENGDKCAWTFHVPSVKFSDNTSWMVQGEWSNQAYNAGTGYANLSGQKGCVDGH